MSMPPRSEEYRVCVLCKRTQNQIWEHERRTQSCSLVVTIVGAAHWECILCRRDRINSGNEGSGSGNETSGSDPGICHAFSQTLPCIGECPESGEEELVAGYRQQEEGAVSLPTGRIGQEGANRACAAASTELPIAIMQRIAGIVCAHPDPWEKLNHYGRCGSRCPCCCVANWYEWLESGVANWLDVRGQIMPDWGCDMCTDKFFLLTASTAWAAATRGPRRAEAEKFTQ